MKRKNRYIIRFLVILLIFGIELLHMPVGATSRHLSVRDDSSFRLNTEAVLQYKITSDSKYVYFSTISDDYKRGDLFHAHLVTRRVEQITNQQSLSEAVEWFDVADDMSHLLYVVYDTSLQRRSVYVAIPPTGIPRQIDEYLPPDETIAMGQLTPFLAPDKQTAIILTRSQQTNSTNIYQVNLEKLQNVRRISDLCGVSLHVQGVFKSSEGRYLLLETNRGKLYRIDLVAYDCALLFETQQGALIFRVQPGKDQQSLFVTVRDSRTGFDSLFRIHTASMISQTILTDVDRIYIAPDETFVISTRNSSRDTFLQHTSIRTGLTTKFTIGGIPELLRIAPNGRFVVFFLAGSSVLMRLDVPQGTLTQLTPPFFAETIQDFDITPDNKQVVFTASRRGFYKGKLFVASTHFSRLKAILPPEFPESNILTYDVTQDSRSVLFYAFLDSQDRYYLYHAALGTGDSSQLMKIPTFEGVASLTLESTPDSKYAVALVLNEKQRPDLFAVKIRFDMYMPNIAK